VCSWSIRGSNVDLSRLLFGSILAVDDAALILIGGIATASLLLLAVIYRPLVVECFDPDPLRGFELAYPMAPATKAPR
jgi:zinc/manganese transport system permease protein